MTTPYLYLFDLDLRPVCIAAWRSGCLVQAGSCIQEAWLYLASLSKGPLTTISLGEEGDLLATALETVQPEDSLASLQALQNRVEPQLYLSRVGSCTIASLLSVIRLENLALDDRGDLLAELFGASEKNLEELLGDSRGLHQLLSGA